MGADATCWHKWKPPRAGKDDKGKQLTSGSFLGWRRPPDAVAEESGAGRPQQSFPRGQRGRVDDGDDDDDRPGRKKSNFDDDDASSSTDAVTRARAAERREKKAERIAKQEARAKRQEAKGKAKRAGDGAADGDGAPPPPDEGGGGASLASAVECAPRASARGAAFAARARALDLAAAEASAGFPFLSRLPQWVAP